MDEKELLSAAARVMSGKRQIVEGTCQVCGAPIKGTKKRKYCSPAHAAQAFYNNHRDEVLADQKRRRDGRASAATAPASQEGAPGGDASAPASPPAPADPTGPEAGTSS